MGGGRRLRIENVFLTDAITFGHLTSFSPSAIGLRDRSARQSGVPCRDPLAMNGSSSVRGRLGAAPVRLTPGAEFQIVDKRPELMKGTDLQILNDAAQKPGSIHPHIGQRPILAAGNTDGDLPMFQWTAASPYRTLALAIHHTDKSGSMPMTPILSFGEWDYAASDRAIEEPLDRGRYGWLLVDCLYTDLRTPPHRARLPQCFLLRCTPVSAVTCAFPRPTEATGFAWHGSACSFGDLGFRPTLRCPLDSQPAIHCVHDYGDRPDRHRAGLPAKPAARPPGSRR